MQQFVFRQPNVHLQQMRLPSSLTVFIFMILCGVMSWSTSVLANAEVTFQPAKSPQFFTELNALSEGLSVGPNSAQWLTFIQRHALQRLLLDEPIKVSNKTILERQLRSAVRAQVLTLPLLQPNDIQASLQAGKVNVVLEWLPEILSHQVATRLQVLDSELRQYLRISPKSNAFKQLKRLMPALYNIEERHALQQLLTLNGIVAPALKNSRLVGFLDDRISRLAGGLTFNMKALVREGRKFEPGLIAALAQQDLIFTAKPPAFVLDYHLESKGQDGASGAWLFDTRIALLNDFGIKIVSAESTLSVVAENEIQAQRQALTNMAESLSQNLRAFLLEKH